jgi:Fungal specific transcription factor domain
LGDPCRQCVRKHLACGGYQDLQDLSFRDQTNQIVQTHSRSSEPSPTSSTSTTKDERFVRPAYVSQGVVDIAFHHLLAFYLPSTHFDYLPNMVDLFSSSKCFVSSTRAVALANLARERKDGGLMRHSRSVYVKAIKEVNQALKSKEVALDSTLVATLILGLFEAIALNDENAFDSSVSACIKSWVAHTNGTLSLIKFRGKELLHTELGKKVYYQVANKIRANCSQLTIRLPADMLELDKEIAPLLQKSHPAVFFWPLIDMAIELGAMDRGMKT